MAAVKHPSVLDVLQVAQSPHLKDPSWNEEMNMTYIGFRYRIGLVGRKQIVENTGWLAATSSDGH
jgi:hypothetical protein